MAAKPLAHGVSAISRSAEDLASATDEITREHERFELAARATQDLLWDWDLRRGTVTWAGNTHAFFGSPPDGTRPPGEDHRMWSDRVHPDDLAHIRAASRAALRTGAASWEHEYRFQRLDGGWTDVLERAIIVRDARGKAVRVVGAMQDISRRKQTEEATTRLAAIVSSSGDAIVGKTVEGIITSWNAGAERIFGYPAAEIVGGSNFRLIPPDLHAAERALLERIRQGERVEYADTIRLHKDGRPIAVALSVSPIFDAAGTVIGASSILRDITERKRVQEELARREERYRALVTATSSIVWMADATGSFLEPQPSWEQYTGQPWEDHRGAGWAEAVHPEDREQFHAAWSRAREGSSLYDFRGRVWSRAHGGYRRVAAHGAPVLDPEGGVREWIGTVTDVEDQWRTEERLRSAERMESVGRLAGGIAHEANNQMTVILGAAEFLQRHQLDPAAREDVRHIQRAAERTAGITQQLLAFSRRQVLQPEVLDLNAVVTALEPILGRALGETSTLVLRLQPALGTVRADPGQIDQVLLNLVLNARDAMPGGGRLTIETADVPVDQAYVAAKPVETLAPGPYVVLTVSDTGQGMDRETLEHVFEPFFTTKEVGQGTGLGLATVYGIVKQSNGFVWAYSEPGQGTAFRVYLPAVQPGTPLTAEPPQETSGGRAEVILVAEDEPMVRAIIARSLRDFGYTVLEAGNGVEALELAERRPVPPDLVIADVVMPALSGRGMAQRLMERWPDIRVLFTSGYTGTDAIGRGLLDPGQEFIQKPLSPEALGRKVRQLLDGPPAPRRHRNIGPET